MTTRTGIEVAEEITPQWKVGPQRGPACMTHLLLCGGLRAVADRQARDQGPSGSTVYPRGLEIPSPTATYSLPQPTRAYIVQGSPS